MKHIKDYWRKIRYHPWIFDRRELLLEIGKGFLLFYVISYLFFNRIYLTLLFVFFIYPWLTYEEERKKKKERMQLLGEMKEMMLSLHNSLYAGYSLENALNHAKKDLIQITGQESRLAYELELACSALKMNQSLDVCLIEMAKHLQLEELDQLVEIILLVQKRGGNLTQILGKTIDHLNQKIQVKEEIITLTAAKVMEQKVMSGMPFFIIFYVRITNPHYFDTLYNNIMGNLVACICLVMLLAAMVLSNRIIEIEV